jgi:Zn-dependent protease
MGIYVVCLVLSIAVHEYFHALFADRLGDPTPESEGRLTLNPIAHADPVGTLALPIIAALTAMPLLGWGKPVPTQPRNYTRKVSMRAGLAIVAVAGPLGNLVLATIVTAIAFVVAASGFLTPEIESVLHTLVVLNVVLMVFNLLPIHPLDGGKILAAFLPPSLEFIDEFLAQYGGYIVIALVVLGGGLLGFVLWPFTNLVDAVWSALPR